MYFSGLISLNEEQEQEYTLSEDKTVFIDKMQNIGVKFKALNIAEFKKGKKRFLVIWVEDLKGARTSPDGRALAVTVTKNTKLNSDFVEKVKPGDKFYFVLGSSGRARGFKFMFV